MKVFMVLAAVVSVLSTAALADECTCTGSITCPVASGKFGGSNYIAIGTNAIGFVPSQLELSRLIPAAADDLKEAVKRASELNTFWRDVSAERARANTDILEKPAYYRSRTQPLKLG